VEKQQTIKALPLQWSVMQKLHYTEWLTDIIHLAYSDIEALFKYASIRLYRIQFQCPVSIGNLFPHSLSSRLTVSSIVHAPLPSQPRTSQRTTPPMDRAMRRVNSAQTTCTTSPEQIEVMKSEGYSGPMCNKHVHSTVTHSSRFHCPMRGRQ